MASTTLLNIFPPKLFIKKSYTLQLTLWDIIKLKVSQHSIVSNKERVDPFSSYTKFCEKVIISNPLIRTRTSAYQRVRNIRFLENFAYVENGWWQSAQTLQLTHCLISSARKPKPIKLVGNALILLFLVSLDSTESLGAPLGFSMHLGIPGQVWPHPFYKGTSNSCILRYLDLFLKGHNGPGIRDMLLIKESHNLIGSEMFGLTWEQSLC